MQMQMDVVYRIEIATATDELCKSKYLKQIFMKMSDKSTQFEIVRKVMSRLEQNSDE